MQPDLNAARNSTRPHRLLPVFQGEEPAFPDLPEGVRDSARETSCLRKFEGKAGETLLLPFGSEQWLLAGLGEKEKLTRPSFCESLAKGFSELKKAGGRRMDLLLPGQGLPWGRPESARLAAEALLMAGYEFGAYRSGEKEEERCSVTLAGGGGRAAGATVREWEEGLLAGRHTGSGIHLARDLINHPAGVANPDFVAEQAKALAKAHGARFRQIRGEKLAAEGFQALHAVGRAAEHPPSLVALDWGARDGKRPTIALVGKGVTFDSGGLDIKPASGMALMKKDMGGAAIVLGAFRAIAGLELPARLVCVVGLAENAVGPRAYHPGDVVGTKRGLTVEITNTDAEGRLVLADAMALALEYEPDCLVDFATLTGACRTALGKELMGLFCENEALREHLLAGAEATGDHVWPLPLWRPYRKMLDSSVADLVNAASSGMAGAVTAALFLREFTGDVAWAHLDCYAWSDGESPLFPKGGSGVGVRLCVELVQRLLENRTHE